MAGDRGNIGPDEAGEIGHAKLAGFELFGDQQARGMGERLDDFGATDRTLSVAGGGSGLHDEIGTSGRKRLGQGGALSPLDKVGNRQQRFRLPSATPPVRAAHDPSEDSARFFEAQVELSESFESLEFLGPAEVRNRPRPRFRTGRLALGAIVLGLLLVLGGGALQKRYLKTNPFYFDPVGYLSLAQDLGREVEEQGRWAVAWAEWETGLFPGYTVPLILLAPDQLRHQTPHLLVVLPMVVAGLLVPAFNASLRGTGELAWEMPGPLSWNALIGFLLGWALSGIVMLIDSDLETPFMLVNVLATVSYSTLVGWLSALGFEVAA